MYQNVNVRIRTETWKNIHFLFSECFLWYRLLPYLFLSLSVFTTLLFLSTLSSWSCLLLPFHPKTFRFLVFLTSQSHFHIILSLPNTTWLSPAFNYFCLLDFLFQITSEQVVCVYHFTCQQLLCEAIPANQVPWNQKKKYTIKYQSVIWRKAK